MLASSAFAGKRPTPAPDQQEYASIYLGITVIELTETLAVT